MLDGRGEGGGREGGGREPSPWLLRAGRRAPHCSSAPSPTGQAQWGGCAVCIEARPSQHRPRPGVDWLSGWMAIGTGWKPLLCTCLLSQDTVICEPFQSVTSWETQKGLSPDHHPRAVNSNQGGLQPEEGVSRMPGYPSASQRDKGEAEACDKSSTRGREKPGFTPSRRHPRCAQAYPRPGTPRSCSFLWWVC